MIRTNSSGSCPSPTNATAAPIGRLLQVAASTTRHQTSVTAGCTTTTTTSDAIIRPNATSDTRMMVPRLAGNLPRMIHCWLTWNLL